MLIIEFLSIIKGFVGIYAEVAIIITMLLGVAASTC
jgi:hypothetical protein